MDLGNENNEEEKIRVTPISLPLIIPHSLFHCRNRKYQFHGCQQRQQEMNDDSDNGDNNNHMSSRNGRSDEWSLHFENTTLRVMDNMTHMDMMTMMSLLMFVGDDDSNFEQQHSHYYDCYCH